MNKIVILAQQIAIGMDYLHSKNIVHKQRFENPKHFSGKCSHYRKMWRLTLLGEYSVTNSTLCNLGNDSILVAYPSGCEAKQLRHLQWTTKHFADFFV